MRENAVTASRSCFIFLPLIMCGAGRMHAGAILLPIEGRSRLVPVHW